MAKGEETFYTDTHLLQDFHARLARWFGEHARSLPWRDTQDAYAIWLSEVILQQTQVVQGMSYYHKFLELYPDVYALASASEDEVLRAWQGLGYYSRGRNLLKAAQMVVSDFGGQFPDTLEEIKRLPGVGPYTQAAILSFAYNKPHAAVDGNVYRVLSRLFADPTPIDTPEGQRHYRQRADELLNSREAGLHNQSMIELGALVCTPRKPDCLFCPVELYCQAKARKEATAYPIKQGKTKVRDRYFAFVLLRLPDGGLLLERRGKGDIWQGLYQLPLIESERELSDGLELMQEPSFAELYEHLDAPILKPRPIAKLQHRLTHRLLHASLYEVEASHYRGEAYQVVPAERLDDYALPALLLKLLSGLHLGH